MSGTLVPQKQFLITTTGKKNTLIARATYLARVERPSHACRVELQAALLLADEGSLQHGVVERLVRRAYSIGAAKALSGDAEACLALVWGRLEGLLAGTVIPNLLDAGISLTPEMWLAHVMDDIGDLVESGSLHPRLFTSLMSMSLMSAAEDVFAAKWFTSPYSLGVALHNLLAGNRQRCRDDSELLRVMVTAVTDAVKAAQQLPANTAQQDQYRVYARLEFFWMLTRGFAFAMVQAADSPGSLLTQIREDSQLRRLLRNALVTGFRVLSDRAVDHPTSWYDRGDLPTDPVELMPIDQLTNHLSVRRTASWRPARA